MKFINPLPFVEDMDRAKSFYVDVMQLCVVQDHQDFVQFENGFALHGGIALHRTIFGCEPEQQEPYGRKNLVLYFEVEDIDASFKRIAPLVDLIHPVKQQSWGQKVFRFFDPDLHIVEIGEPQ